MLRYYNHLLLQNKYYPLDYIHGVPLELTPRPFKNEEYLEMLHRRNTLKNIVMRMIIDIREKNCRDQDLSLL